MTLVFCKECKWFDGVAMCEQPKYVKTTRTAVSEFKGGELCAIVNKNNCCTSFEEQNRANKRQPWWKLW